MLFVMLMLSCNWTIDIVQEVCTRVQLHRRSTSINTIAPGCPAHSVSRIFFRSLLHSTFSFFPTFWVICLLFGTWLLWREWNQITIHTPPRLFYFIILACVSNFHNYHCTGLFWLVVSLYSPSLPQLNVLHLEIISLLCIRSWEYDYTQNNGIEITTLILFVGFNLLL